MGGYVVTWGAWLIFGLFCLGCFAFVFCIILITACIIKEISDNNSNNTDKEDVEKKE